MSVQFLKPAGLRLLTSRTDTAVNRKDKIPWYVYFIGAAIYTALAGWLFAESSPLAWICAISAPLGYYYAWGAWKREKRNRVDA
jgi:hypothetical protein